MAGFFVGVGLIVTVILILMLAGLVSSALMLLPRPAQAGRDEQRNGDILEGECSDWKLWVLRAVCLVIMAIAMERVYDSGGSLQEVLAWGLVYAGAFFLHYGIMSILKRTYYFSSEGIWINRLRGEPIPYERIEILKVWRTCAPFSGCAGNLMLIICVEGNKYRVLFPRDEEDGANEGELPAQEQILNWIPMGMVRQNTEQALEIWKKAGIFCIALGIGMTLLFGFFAARGTGMFEPAAGNANYKQVRMQEPAVYGIPDAAYESEGGNLYLLFRDYSCVNLYDAKGNFLYAYQVPKGENGAMEFSVNGKAVAIKNKDDQVYCYKETQFVREETLREFMEHGKINFVPDGNDLGKAALIRKQKGWLPGDEGLPYAIFGVVVVLCGMAIYNKSRFFIKRP